MRDKQRTVLSAIVLGAVMFSTGCGNSHPLVGTWRTDLYPMQPSGAQQYLSVMTLDVTFTTEMRFTTRLRTVLLGNHPTYAGCEEIMVSTGGIWTAPMMMTTGALSLSGVQSATVTRRGCRDATQNVSDMSATGSANTAALTGTPDFTASGSSLTLRWTQGSTIRTLNFTAQ